MHSIAWWPTLIVLAVATFTDLRSRRIPNWLIFPFLLAGVAISGWRVGLPGIDQSIAGMGVGLLIYGVLYWMGGIGAGDVKLCVAIGAWIGPDQLFLALVISAMAGGIMALCWGAFGGFLREMFTGASELVFEWKTGGDTGMSLANPLKRKMPYVPAIAIGTLVSFFSR